MAPMLTVLLVLFVALPFVELAVLIAVGGQIGVLNTIALVLIVGAAGAWLSKREGLGVLRRLNETLNQGQVPTKELIDGGLILFAGALMITPGFVSDIVGILLLLPPTRALFRAALVHRFQARIERAVTLGGPAGFTRFGFSTVGASPGGFGAPGGPRGSRMTGGFVDTTGTDTTGRANRTDRSDRTDPPRSLGPR